MRLDVIDLARFYGAPLGQAAQSMILRRLTSLWPHTRGLDVLGLGYATPFLAPYQEHARRVVSAMPAPQGVERWPVGRRATASLVEETRLPFREAVFDRVVIAHVLEETESLRAVLREVWRVTAPEARIVVIAANRRGLWARAETSPFGHGRSFTRGQLAGTLRACMLEPTAWARALYAPPLHWGPVARSAEAWERAGERLWSRLSGVLLVEAIKRVAAQPSGLHAPAMRPATAGVRAFGGVVQGAREEATSREPASAQGRSTLQ